MDALLAIAIVAAMVSALSYPIPLRDISNKEAEMLTESSNHGACRGANTMKSRGKLSPIIFTSVSLLAYIGLWLRDG